MVTAPRPLKPGARPASGAAGIELGSAGTPTSTGGWVVDVVVVVLVVVVGAAVLGAAAVVVLRLAVVVVVTGGSGDGDWLSAEQALTIRATAKAIWDNRDITTI